MTDDWRSNYVPNEGDINTLADQVTAGDPRAMQVPNGTVAALIARLRDSEAERDEALRQIDALVTADKAKQGAADWMLQRLHNDRLINDDAYTSLCGLLRDQIDATRNWTHSEDWGPLRDRLRAALKRAGDAERECDAALAEVERLKVLLGERQR